MFIIFRIIAALVCSLLCLTACQYSYSNPLSEVYYEGPEEVISILNPSSGEKILANEISVWFKPGYTQDTVDSITKDISGVVVGITKPLRCIYIRFNPPVSTYSQLEEIIKLVGESPFVDQVHPVGAVPMVLE